jgi:hypothetical protein
MWSTRFEDCALALRVIVPTTPVVASVVGVRAVVRADGVVGWLAVVVIEVVGRWIEETAKEALE